MTPEQFAQEFECSFDAAILGSYYASEIGRAQEQGRIRRVPVDRFVPVITCWDLGYTDSTAIWFGQVVGQELHWIDYYEANSEGLDHYAQVMAEKMAGWGKGVRWGEHFFPHDLQAHMIGMDRSRVETLRTLGIEPTTVPVHQVNDGINAVRRIFDRFWFDEERCHRGLEALRQYRRDFDEKTKTFKPNPRHDWTSHGADALRTFAAGWPGAKLETKTLDRHRRKLYAPKGDSGWMSA
jgi:phage terminase large subunit